MDTLTTAAGELYTLYHKDIVRFFAEHLAIGKLCHEVFVRLLLTLLSGAQLAHPQRWLLRVARNLLIDSYRHQHTVSEVNLPCSSLLLQLPSSQQSKGDPCGHPRTELLYLVRLTNTTSLPPSPSYTER